LTGSFFTRSTVMQAYLDEARPYCRRRAVEQQQQHRWPGLQSILPQQIRRLHRETAALAAARVGQRLAGSRRWQRKRLEHQEFERRLFEMKRERKERLAQATAGERSKLPS
jgi:primosomal replication protein N''